MVASRLDVRAGGRGALAAAGFAVACLAPFAGKPIHMDEPLFLAAARHILQSPLHPFDFAFNWYGRAVPYAQLNNTPPLFSYVLAAALKLSGGSELALRLLFLPFPALAAAALYLLAARFLRRPLLPALICVACPAFVVNMGLIYPEVPAAPLALWGLYALVAGVDDDRPKLYWGSAALIGLSLLFKYFAVFALLPAAGYALARGAARRRVALHAAACLSGAAVLAAVDRLLGPSSTGAVWRTLAEASSLPVWSWTHKLRSTLCFIGGGGVATFLWPGFAVAHRRRQALALLAVCAALFSPWLDLAAVRPIDRLTGFVMGGGALAGLWALFVAAPRGRGWPLWAPWTLSATLVMACLYWAIVARLAFFAVPPLAFFLAELLESRRSDPALRRLYAATLAFSLSLSLGLDAVDLRYATSQRDAARRILAYYGPGRRLWTLAHWGLQYYLEQGDVRELDFNAGGWDVVAPDDVVIVTRLSSPQRLPRAPIKADVSVLTIEEPLPLRLLSGWGGEAGFFSNALGFLPYSFSAEPLEEVTVVRRLP